MAQTGQQFGFLIGGSSRLYSESDKQKARDFCTAGGQAEDCVTFPSKYKLSDRDIEVFYAVELDSTTTFKIRAGQINTDVGVIEASNFVRPSKGHIEHADGIVQYAFSEPFGKTGVFAGIGMYRWSGDNIASDTNYGYTLGINADFPITRRHGFIVEGSYHWLNTSSPVRYITLTGGLRIGF